MSTPVTLAAVWYIQRSPGWQTSGSAPSRRIHSSGGGSGSSPWSAFSASEIGTVPGSAGTMPVPRVKVSRSRTVIGPFRRDGLFERPVRIGEHGHVRQFREELVDRVVEAERAVLDERHRAGGDDRLGHRAGAADRVGRHRRPRARALEGESACRLDVDLAAAGDDGDRTRDVAGVDVTLQHVSHPGQPFRREASSGHGLLLTLSASYPGGVRPMMSATDPPPGGPGRRARQRAARL